MSTERRDGSPNISAVILDYGQVLARCPTVPEFARMAKMFNVSFESFYERWEGSRDSYDRSDVTAEEYWLKLAAQTNSSISREQIEILRQVEIEIWAHTDPDMLDWLSRLHAAGIKTGLLSNMPLDLASHVRKNCKWMENFTFKTFSGEVKLIKPDPAIYKRALDILGRPPERVLFIDDRPENVAGATGVGMQGIRFTGAEQLRRELVTLGVI